MYYVHLVTKIDEKSSYTDCFSLDLMMLIYSCLPFSGHPRDWEKKSRDYKLSLHNNWLHKQTCWIFLTTAWKFGASRLSLTLSFGAKSIYLNHDSGKQMHYRLEINYGLRHSVKDKFFFGFCWNLQ